MHIRVHKHDLPHRRALAIFDANGSTQQTESSHAEHTNEPGDAADVELEFDECTADVRGSSADWRAGPAREGQSRAQYSTHLIHYSTARLQGLHEYPHPD